MVVGDCESSVDAVLQKRGDVTAENNNQNVHFFLSEAKRRLSEKAVKRSEKANVSYLFLFVFSEKRFQFFGALFTLIFDIIVKN
jgi:hypothetical protein